MRALEIMPAAKGDIDRHRSKHRRAMARIVVRLQEIAADPRLLEKMLDPGFGGDRWKDVFYVDDWIEQREQGRKLRYLKVWEVENIGERFRVVYAHNPTTDIIHVLGITPREFDYEPEHAFTKRIIADYGKLGCPHGRD